MQDNVRVRFAPSPTGGLHLGGVRTVLFNYLFARQNGGKFILRIEDTDQTRYVPGAEEYIQECLKWCGLHPDEGPENGGPYGPYRQSERKALYRQYAEQLVEQGYAYYAFDTPEELEQKRKDIANFQYGYFYRSQMRNSLSLDKDEVSKLLESGFPYVIRIKMPEDETVSFTDMIRGEVNFQTSQSDDKVLLKADGMPTYHLAVVVDDYLMKITHAFRGEEWLPSAPVHLLLWKYLGWKDEMPQWAHLPLILKPDGNGKLSKRDGARLGFPVYAMNWTDPNTGDLTPGFREIGFLPEAFINMLVMLGWNDGTDQEIFSLEQLTSKFSLERVNKAGAKFDYEKAKWFNSEWIKKLDKGELQQLVAEKLSEAGIDISDDSKLGSVIGLVKDRCHLLTDFVAQSSYFFKSPADYDLNAVKPKWTEAKQEFFEGFADFLLNNQSLTAQELEEKFKALAQEKGFKIGDVMLPYRVMLVGGKFGPAVFDITKLIGEEEAVTRVKKALGEFTKD
ncbi:glutamate--tRNA ligase [Pararcticibacter amylolyticus]|uniref:Glutamate--tRNA ligase n=1 Tax=Pararcticibacter amylolyticus TaxID=2173175 RepID=A0A2U2PMJ9_9SPHI|nr:glutamate--tRNA ligase [Pararcticibacter amylolyticus]PWG82625.1 glutamate--tRNA ligase [Pararcticibacter amylolyticus]